MPATVVIKDVWNDLVHTLKGEWISIQGTSKATEYVPKHLGQHLYL
jgi:hypothetical protein